MSKIFIDGRNHVVKFETSCRRTRHRSIGSIPTSPRTPKADLVRAQSPPVDLHLLAWFGLKPDYRIVALLREEAGHELLQDRYATFIAPLSSISSDSARRCCP
jgi:hypothetical protein